MITKKLLATFAFAIVLLFSGCADDDFEQIDGVCPLVNSTIPENLATNVPLDQIITATFNEKMNPLTISEASFTVASGALINGTVSYTDSTAVFTPSSLLDENTEYTATIKTLAKDLRGNALQEDYVWTFVTVLPLPEYTVVVSSNPVIGGVTTGGGVFDEGTEVTVTAAANAGYEFVNWTAAGVEVSTNENYTFTLNANTTLVANYSRIQFAVNLSSSPSIGGTTAGDGVFDEGTDVTVMATANTGYTFVNWTAAGVEVSTNTTYTFTLNEATALVANFDINTFTLVVNALNGMVEIVPNQATYDFGDMVVLNPIPDSGYEFTSWSLDATGNDDPLNVLMDADKEITANFSVIPPPTCTPAVDLGTAGNYVILAESAISTTGTTSITGDMGISPAAATFITGFALNYVAGSTFATSNLVTGKVYAPGYANPTPANLVTAVDNMRTAFTTGNGLAPDTTELLVGNLNGQTLAAGVYKWSTGLSITNGITLDGGGDPCAMFVFQIDQDLTVADNAIITLANGAKAENIYWLVAGSGAILGTTVQFQGNILSKTLISLNTGATVNGRLLAQTAVTLNANSVVKPE
ncbi:ice-binding family protein [uncultured Polaribacter sp.]|uniref:ice-binding family protein n=1 Tax=uncultured Polaribacter sp. TaxID=174711 RepID=UPI002636652E|nr:ice-binding family protein [uncultured Polaribacter sp.]